MADVQSNEEFEHYHGDCIKNLRLEEVRLAEARKEMDLGEIDTLLEKELQDLLEKWSASSAQGPEQVFKLAMRSLKAADSKQFIIENVLESLKRGDDYPTIVRRFRNLGFLPVHEDNPEPRTPMQATIALVNRKSIWERVRTFLTQGAVNALKTVPKWIEVEPIVSPLPPFISFALKGKGMSAQELIESFCGIDTTKTR